jgi:hypothetical protein
VFVYGRNDRRGIVTGIDTDRELCLFTSDDARVLLKSRDRDFFNNHLSFSVPLAPTSLVNPVILSKYFDKLYRIYLRQAIRLIQSIIPTNLKIWI